MSHVATEMVLLSQMPVTPEVLDRAYRAMGMQGQVVELRGGEFTSCLSAEGSKLLLVCRAKRLRDVEEASAAVEDLPPGMGLWTEMLVPFEDTGVGRRLAESIASEVDGLLRERV